jgi:NADH-quinone oxidoreductase subunit J
MEFEKYMFYLFACILIFSALRVITARNSVYAVLFLVLAFFTSAALWLLIEAEFLAITMILVYVGAVMVLFLFVVMMLDINVTSRESLIKYLPVGSAVATVIVIEMVLMVTGTGYFDSDKYRLISNATGYSNAKELGSILYTFYVYPFEIASIILLVAIIAAISLTLRRRLDTKSQNLHQQIQFLKNDRVQLIKLAAEREIS